MIDVYYHLIMTQVCANMVLYAARSVSSLLYEKEKFFTAYIPLTQDIFDTNHFTLSLVKNLTVQPDSYIFVEQDPKDVQDGFYMLDDDDL